MVWTWIWGGRELEPNCNSFWSEFTGKGGLYYCTGKSWRLTKQQFKSPLISSAGLIVRKGDLRQLRGHRSQAQQSINSSGVKFGNHPLFIEATVFVNNSAGIPCFCKAATPAAVTPALKSFSHTTDVLCIFALKGCAESSGDVILANS